MKRTFIVPEMVMTSVASEKMLAASGSAIIQEGETVLNAMEDCLAVGANIDIENEDLKKMIDDGDNCFYYCEDAANACQIASVRALGAAAKAAGVTQPVIKVTYTTSDGKTYYKFQLVSDCTPAGNGYPPNCVTLPD